MLTMSYFSLLVNYYLYYYINHSRFWPILSRDLLRNKILQKRINNEKVTLLFTGVQIIKSNSIKLDFWSTPKGRFSMRWYIGAFAEGMSYVVMWFVPLLIVAGMNHRILSRLTRIQRDSTRRWFVEICVNLWLII